MDNKKQEGAFVQANKMSREVTAHAHRLRSLVSVNRSFFRLLYLKSDVPLHLRLSFHQKGRQSALPFPHPPRADDQKDNADAENTKERADTVIVIY